MPQHDAQKVIIPEPFKVSLEKFDLPPLKPTQFLVKTLFTGISAGTELTHFCGTNPGFATGRLSYPREMGYELVGEVVETGADVNGITVGDIVFSFAPHQSYTVLDTAPTAINDYFVHLRNNVNPEAGLFIALTTTAIHGIHRSDIKLGDSVCVIGLGVLGLLELQVAKLAGAGKVAGIDLLDFRIQLAKKLGIQATFNASDDELEEKAGKLTGGFGFDIIIEASGAPAAVNTALELARDRGTVVIMGYHVKPLENIVPGRHFWEKELSLISSRATGPGRGLPREYVRWDSFTNLQEAARLINTGLICTDGMITHRFKSNQIEDAYKALLSNNTDMLQVVLDWTT